MKNIESVGCTFFLAFITLAVNVIGVVYATDADLNLPSTLITIEVFDGTESYFITKLMDVPQGYDVSNETYLGWCIDTRAEMTRSPATHSVYLYSSFNPPGELANESWDMVNYILNHKRGNATDIQQAIWYFINIDGNYTPTSQVAWDIINDALENGEGFVPGYGEIVTVICYPTVLLPYPSEVQISIIEVNNPVIPEFSSAFILSLIMSATLLIAIFYKKKNQKVSLNTLRIRTHNPYYFRSNV
jgi:hypothetical protein